MNTFKKTILIVVLFLAVPAAIIFIGNFWGSIIYDIFWKMSKEQLESIYPFARVIIPCMSIAAAAVPWLIYFGSRKRKKEIIRKSEENDTFVTARLVRSQRVYSKRANAANYRGTYEYTVNGEVKEYQLLTGGQPPNEIRLYRKSENSNKFFSDAGTDNPSWAIPLLCLYTFILLIVIGSPLDDIKDLISYKNKFG